MKQTKSGQKSATTIKVYNSGLIDVILNLRRPIQSDKDAEESDKDEEGSDGEDRSDYNEESDEDSDGERHLHVKVTKKKVPQTETIKVEEILPEASLVKMRIELDLSDGVEVKIIIDDSESPKEPTIESYEEYDVQICLDVLSTSSHDASRRFDGAVMVEILN